jgi:hypothetical protein
MPKEPSLTENRTGSASSGENMGIERPSRMRRLGLAGASLALAGALMSGTAGMAVADPGGPSDVASTVFVMGDPSSSGPSAYADFLNHLRNAAGHQWRGGNVFITTADTRGIVSAEINFRGGSVTLYFTACDLYLRGYQTSSGLYEFSGYDLGRRLGVTAHPLPFGENYTELERAARQNRQDMYINHETLYNSYRTLATVHPSGANTQRVARALLQVITTTSEAARVNQISINVDYIFSGGYDFRFTPQMLEDTNSWGRMSSWAIANSQNPNNSQPLQVGGVTIHSFDDIARELGVVQSNHGEL